ncbi:U3 small nucleolar RNA-associated protein 6-domain-containing protein [Dichotomocladium elegans]|nr:U3 small nucleolar RNA-associated protein 6-domain-containing protein [Dichotomocladium elegans]
MADTVQYFLEQMVPELEDLERKGLFSKAEIKSIVKKRTKFEYATRRRILKKIDFLRYIEYEMNLESLRTKRKARLQGQTADQAVRGISDFSLRRRINSLFERALIRFKGDLSLWMQYIDHAKASKSNNLLSGIFANALQLHPRKPVLWIMAASWEFQQNANPAAARMLMQRALRLNPTDDTLWHEYFRLELMYIEKIKQRRKVLGIDEKSLKEQEDKKKDEDAMEVDNENSDMIKLPTITGEEMANDEEESSERKTVQRMEASAAEALKEGSNPILQGALAKIIYDNAIDTKSDDLGFRTQFVDIYRQFTETEAGIAHVLETIRRDLSDNTAARAYLAQQHLFIKKKDAKDSSNYITCMDPEFVPALKASVDEFNAAVEDLPIADMYERFVSFLQGWLEIVSEDNLKLYLQKIMQRVFKASQKKNITSATLYQLYIENLIPLDIDQAKRVAAKATEAYPSSPQLWTSRIQLEDDKLHFYKQALRHCGESYALWESYIGWIKQEWSKESLSIPEADKLFSSACESATSLLPSLTTSTEERDQIKGLVLSSYVHWALEANGIATARSVYRKIIQNLYPTYAFYATCLKIEEENNGEEDAEYVFEMALRLKDHKEEFYRKYIAHLRDRKKFTKADHILWKACKEVPDFDTKKSQQ